VHFLFLFRKYITSSGVIKTVEAATGACHWSGRYMSSKDVRGRLPLHYVIAYLGLKKKYSFMLHDVGFMKKSKHVALFAQWRIMADNVVVISGSSVYWSRAGWAVRIQRVGELKERKTCSSIKVIHLSSDGWAGVGIIRGKKKKQNYPCLHREGI